MFYELISAISLGLIAAFLFFPYNTYRIDRVRQQLFAIRDNLFDDAVRGKISFNSEAYIATRTLLNGVIRFSHQLSYSRLLAYRALVKENSASNSFFEKIESSAESDQQIVKKYINQANVAVINHVLSSPIVVMIVIPALCVYLLKFIVGFDIANSIIQRRKRDVADFDRVAFREGMAA